MNVLLINPPKENEIIGNNPAIIEEERGYNPPLGILYIAGYLEKYTDHDVAVIDAQVEQLNQTSLASRIESIDPDVVGITTMTMTLVDVIRTIDTIRKPNKDTKIILGGPHVHLFPDETLRSSNADYLVLGEGERTFSDLIEHLNDKKLKHVPGLVFKHNGNVVNTGLRPAIEDLDSLPFPARNLIPIQKYSSLLSKGKVVTTIITSRGCPFKCSFCARPHLGKKFRARSPVNVVEELEECVKMGIREFLFYDDTFTINKQRVLGICDEIVRRKLEIGWDIRARVDTVDEEMLGYLKNAGCQGIHYGVEAGTDNILNSLNKGITISQVQKAFALTRKHKISVLAYFMIGNPGETKDDIETTFRVMKSLKPDYTHITILTPFPGTEIYSKGLKTRVIKRDFWREFAKNPSSNFVPPHWGEILTREELNRLLVKGYHTFYIRLFYILRRLKTVRSFGEIRKMAYAGLKVLRMK